jgi:phospholipase C
MRRAVVGCGRVVGVVGLLVLAWFVAVAAPGWAPRHRPALTGGPVPFFAHVFVIMLENQSPAVLNLPQARDLRRLAAQYAYDPDYYGVTHPSLPNYVAAITGRTGGSHSDNPTQRFAFPSLPAQLDRHGITWQAVMQGLPYPGYQGDWYPAAGAVVPTVTPAQALYAKKHDPFLLLAGLSRQDRDRVVPLRVFGDELRSGSVPRFVWISPDLCHDMHGQPALAGARCPENHPAQLVAAGDRFVRTWVDRIEASPAWTGNTVIFVVWDEGSGSPLPPTPGNLWSYLAAGPAAPPLVPWAPGVLRIGGGRTPLIVIARHGPRHARAAIWADHYSLLKTIEASWHLPYLGHARDADVPLLTPLVTSSGNR